MTLAFVASAPVRLAQAGHRKACAKQKVIDRFEEFDLGACEAYFLTSRTA
jgi:hypothetical protein